MIQIKVEKKQAEPKVKPQPKPTAEDEKNIAVTTKAVYEKLAEIKTKAPDFSGVQFLNGATQAYEMVMQNFKAGNTLPLKELLSAPIYKAFEQDIKDRKTATKIQDSVLVSILSQKIADATITNNHLKLAVDFLTEQIHVTRNKEGKIVGGNAHEMVEVKDRWWFEKNLQSNNPNWVITTI